MGKIQKNIVEDTKKVAFHVKSDSTVNCKKSTEMSDSRAPCLRGRKEGPTATRPMRLSSERGGETETRKEAYGDPIPQNVNFLD